MIKPISISDISDSLFFENIFNGGEESYLPQEADALESTIRREKDDNEGFSKSLEQIQHLSKTFADIADNLSKPCKDTRSQLSMTVAELLASALNYADLDLALRRFKAGGDSNDNPGIDYLSSGPSESPLTQMAKIMDGLFLTLNALFKADATINEKDSSSIVDIDKVRAHLTGLINQLRGIIKEIFVNADRLTRKFVYNNLINGCEMGKNSVTSHLQDDNGGRRREALGLLCAA